MGVRKVAELLAEIEQKDKEIVALRAQARWHQKVPDNHASQKQTGLTSQHTPTSTYVDGKELLRMTMPSWELADHILVLKSPTSNWWKYRDAILSRSSFWSFSPEESRVLMKLLDGFLVGEELK